MTTQTPDAVREAVRADIAKQLDEPWRDRVILRPDQWKVVLAALDSRAGDAFDMPEYAPDDISHLEGLAAYIDGVARDKGRAGLPASKSLFEESAKRLREYDVIRNRDRAGDAGEADREALAGYRAAVSFISADSWDGCGDCMEILKAARAADWQNAQAADLDETARQLARIRQHRPDYAAPAVDAVPAGEVERARQIAADTIGVSGSLRDDYLAGIFDSGDHVRIALASLSHGEGRK